MHEVRESNRTLNVNGSRVTNELDETAQRNLLAWCRSVTEGYYGVEVRDFTETWRDGRAFLAILHRYR